MRRLGLYAAVLLTIVLHLTTSSPFTTARHDWQSFMASGRAARDGLNPYAVYPTTLIAEYNGRSFPAPNLNPPVLLPVFALFSTLDDVASYHLWQALSLLAYLWAAIALIRTYNNMRPDRLLWLIAFTPLWSTLALGQVYMLQLALATGAWFCLQGNRPRLAGILIGTIAATKPNFLVWPVLLLLSGHRLSALWSAIAFVASNAIALLLYGPDVYLQWATVIGSVETSVVPANFSLVGLSSRLGAPSLGTFLAFLLLVLTAVWALRARPAPLDVSRVSLTASILASPIAWPGYAVVLLPLLLSDPRDSASAWLLCVPQILCWSWGGMAALGYCAACLLLLLQTLRSAAHSSAS